MKKTARFAAFLLAFTFVFGFFAPVKADSPEPAEPGLTILFTHDTHDHFLPSPREGGGEYGGYTRLATRLNEERERAAALGNQVVTLDAGDFSMGSLFQTVYATDAPELRALGAMGYDATTLGNHEFDYRANGLASMLNAAVEAREDSQKALLSSSTYEIHRLIEKLGGSYCHNLPKIVQANYKPPEEDTETWEAWNRYGVSDYTVLEKTASNGESVRIAVFGVLGVDADECAPMSGMEFEPIADAAKRVVKDIQAKEAADYIICLSHSGTSKGKGEDYDLAKAVDGIDVIISGHTHSTLKAPIQVNDTLIVSCGEYTQNLGVLTVDKEGQDGAVELLGYSLLPIDETVADDPDMTAMAENFKTLVDESYLSGFGLAYDQVLARSDFDFTPISQFGAQQGEDGLGNLIADSYIYAVREAEGADYVPIDFAVVASGVVRASFAKGDITVSDAFNVSSLGSGGDGTPGYPLISVYITGKELKDAFEVDASVTPIMPAAQLWGSGMTWTYNPNRMIFNKVTDCRQVLDDGRTISIDDNALYRVVTGLYSGQMLGAVNGKSFGILTITPKDKDGNVVTDFEKQIIHTPGGSEVKEWYALASYLQSMRQVDHRYQAPEGRKVIHPSWNPIELLKSPNWITILALVLVILLLALVVYLVYRIVTRKRHKLKKQAKKAKKQAEKEKKREEKEKKKEAQAPEASDQP